MIVEAELLLLTRSPSSGYPQHQQPHLLCPSNLDLIDRPHDEKPQGGPNSSPKRLLIAGIRGTPTVAGVKLGLWGWDA